MNKLRVYRKLLGWTRRELAEKVGLTYSMILIIERERFRPSKNSATRICDALNEVLPAPVGLNVVFPEYFEARSK